MNKIMHKAFSLIELMVVIAIVAVLASVAVPTYKQYLIKLYVVKNIQIISDKLTPELMLYYNLNGSFPASGWTPGVGMPPGIPAWIAWDGNQVFCRYSGSPYTELEGKQISLYPTINTAGNAINWTCASESQAPFSVKCAYLPGNCQAGCTP